MFAVHHHNEHIFNNPGMCTIIGPYNDLSAAKAGLAKLVAEMDDPLFKIDPDPDAEDNDGTYAGFHWEELMNKGRDEDLATEIWAEIVEIAPPK